MKGRMATIYLNSVNALRGCINSALSTSIPLTDLVVIIQNIFSVKRISIDYTALPLIMCAIGYQCLPDIEKGTCSHNVYVCVRVCERESDAEIPK